MAVSQASEYVTLNTLEGLPFELFEQIIADVRLRELYRLAATSKTLQSYLAPITDLLRCVRNVLQQSSLKTLAQLIKNKYDNIHDGTRALSDIRDNIQKKLEPKVKPLIQSDVIEPYRGFAFQFPLGRIMDHGFVDYSPLSDLTKNLSTDQITRYHEYLSELRRQEIELYRSALLRTYFSRLLELPIDSALPILEKDLNFIQSLDSSVFAGWQSCLNKYKDI